MEVKKKPDGSRIRQLRTELGLRRTEFGAKIGYTHQQIMRVEDGQTPVSDELCRRICQEYKVDEKWLSGEEVTVRSNPEEDGRKRRSRLRQVYEESGLTQREFGRKTHTATSMLNDVVSGRRQMTIRYAKKIEETLGVGVDWLLYGDEAAKEYPCEDRMVRYIKAHPELRKQIWDEMNESGDGDTEDGGDKEKQRGNYG